MKSSKEPREELSDIRPGPRVAQGSGQVEGSKGTTNLKAMSEKVTTPSVTLADELQQTHPCRNTTSEV